MLECYALQWGPTGKPLTPPLDLQLSAGELLLVSGANGAGKSSLLRVLAGQLPALHGSWRLSGNAPGAVGWLRQQHQLDRQFPIDLQSLIAAGAWGRRFGRREMQRALDQVCAEWQLEGLRRHPLAALSGGELQRALLARLQLQQPALLLLDEPEAALDAAGAELLHRALQRWQAQGCSLLLCTHQPDRWAARAGQTLVLSARQASVCRLGSMAGEAA